MELEESGSLTLAAAKLASGPITSWQTDGETTETRWQTLFLGSPKSLQMVTAAMKLKDACSLGENL